MSRTVHRVLVVVPHDTVDGSLQLTTNRRIRHLRVLDGDSLVGLVSIGDLVKAIIVEQAFEIEQLQGHIAGTP